MRRIFLLASLLLLSYLGLSAQTRLSNGIEIDKTVHNFGDIILKSGPVSCTFTLENKGAKPVVIYNVATTCGCTDVSWTREPLKPGAKGKVTVVYSNDEGAYPFDKNITVYMSDEKKPVVLKLRGVSTQKPRPLEEQYPVRFGSLGLKDSSFKCGNIEQGGSKSEAVMVANLSNEPISLSFKDVSKNLEISVSPKTIPARGTAELRFTVTADRSVWGKNMYYATPLINGRTYKNAEGESKIGVWAFTKENFSQMSDEERQRGAMPRFETSTFAFGKAKLGDVIEGEFSFKNEGKSEFKVYKVDADVENFSADVIPGVSAGGKQSFKVRIDTKGMKKGEALIIVTLTTNSPSRPIVNLFVSGVLE